MAIGSYLACLKTNKLKKYLISLFGTFDYHTHLRVKPLIKYAKQVGVGKNIIEIGCGSGTIAFELNERVNINEYIGIDLNERAINEANRIKKIQKNENISFFCQDAFEFIKNKLLMQKIDTVILFDFLEHIEEPTQFLKELNTLINNPNVTYIISIPTPLYPKVFGKNFHKKVGHLVDGYSLEDVRDIFNSIHGKLVYYRYSTGLIGNIGANLFYSKLSNWRIEYRAIITLPFRLLFDINSSTCSTSIFCVINKP